MISFDGADIHDIALDVLRGGIGYVPQDNFLFSEAIAENIRFYAPEATMEDIEQAAKLADIYDSIQEFPDGFQTQVGERGVTLSGGQKQRISIARALVKRPRILILDDALSAVDAKTEQDIWQSPARRVRGRHLGHHRGAPRQRPAKLRRDPGPGARAHRRARHARAAHGPGRPVRQHRAQAGERGGGRR